MGRQSRAGGRYIQPILTDGTLITTEAPLGFYTLSANTTYFYILAGAGATRLSAHVIGRTPGMIITSIGPIQDCNAFEQQVTNGSTAAGEWMTEDPTTAFVAVDGTGWTVAAGGTVAVAGTGVGGAMFHFDGGAARCRLVVVVGAAGGVRSVSEHGKD